MHSGIVIAPLALCLGLCSTLAGLAQGPGGLLPDVRGAERELIRARDELEEIAGDRRDAVPALPVLDAEELSLIEREKVRVDRLFEVDPEMWTEEDRLWVQELLPFALTLRAALATGEEGEGKVQGEQEVEEGGEVAGAEELGRRSLVLLRAMKIVALGDRLADLDGDLSTFLDGVEVRSRLAERFFLQPGFIGCAIGSAIHQGVLQDLRRVVGRPLVPREALDRIDLDLLLWQQAVPDPAEVVAIEGLSNLERAEHLPGQLGGVGDAAAALFVAPMARDFADLARICRETGCAGGAAFLDRRREEGDDPFRVISDMMMPDILSLTTRLDGVARLTKVARLAIALRLEGLEMGGYPVAPEELPVVLVARLDEIEGLEYEWLDGRVRLKLPSKELLSQWPEARREWLESLFVWELPAPACRWRGCGSGSAAAGAGPAAAKMPSSQGTS